MILGIDTSNYTTSLCLVDEHGSIVKEARRLLQVEGGERGLQQSEALFQHVKNLPALMEEIGAFGEVLQGICVSTRPRPIEGSYMPVFLAGEGLARSLAAVHGVPLYRTSHQEGHIAAGEGSAVKVAADEFIAVQLSGGTTDVLHVRRLWHGYDIEQMGSSTDLHAGQFVDRVGVAMGLPFPAGPHLEKLARTIEGSDDSSTLPSLPSPVNGYNLSFAGPETAARRLLEKGTAHAQVARAVERCIGKGLEKVLRQAVADTGIRDVLVVGGVAANLFLRKRLIHRLEHPAVKAKLYFATPAYSTDNAFGVARIGLNWHSQTGKRGHGIGGEIVSTGEQS